MEFALWVLFGLVGGAVGIVLSRSLDRERAVFGGALLIAGVWSVGFGAAAGRSLAVLWPQILGGTFFVLCGVLGLRRSLVFLSIGWLVHIGWDFAINDGKATGARLVAWRSSRSASARPRLCSWSAAVPRTHPSVKRRTPCACP